MKTFVLCVFPLILFYVLNGVLIILNQEEPGIPYNNSIISQLLFWMGIAFVGIGASFSAGRVHEFVRNRMGQSSPWNGLASSFAGLVAAISYYCIGFSGCVFLIPRIVEQS